MNYKCPNCQTEYDLVESGNYECVNCHAVFTFQNHGKKSPEPIAKSTCPFCKLEIPEGAKKCGHCGEWISGTAPVKRNTYLLLSFLFGNWGVAEIYIGNTMVAIVYFILNLIFVACSTQEPAAIFAVGALWLFQFIVALYLAPSAEPEKPKRKATKSDKVFCIVCWLLGSVIICGIVGAELLKYFLNQ